MLYLMMDMQLNKDGFNIIDNITLICILIIKQQNYINSLDDSINKEGKK